MYRNILKNNRKKIQKDQLLIDILSVKMNEEIRK